LECPDDDDVDSSRISDPFVNEMYSLPMPS